jgi:hypothetical protein
MARRKPPDRLEAHLNPHHLFLAGVVVIVAFLFQGDLLVRAIQVSAFALTATLAGKRIKLLYFAIMVVSITFFNLLTPVGEVLFTVVGLPVTRGALEQGLLKSLAILGLVFISLTVVGRGLRFPGRFGGLVAKVFHYFEQILEGKGRVSARHLVRSIDDILVRLYPGTVVESSGGQTVRTDMIGGLFLGTLVSCNVVLAILF